MPEALKPKRLIDVVPSLAAELATLLVEAEEPELAAQIRGLGIVDRCRCGDDFCGSLNTQPKPNGSYSPDHRTLALTPDKGMVIIDVVASRIMFVEVLYRDAIRKAVNAAVP